MDKILREDLNIRKIQKADNLIVKKLIIDVMSEYNCVGENSSSSDPELEDMFLEYNSGNSEFYVIEKDNLILGCGGFAHLKDGAEDTCELRKMYFQKEIRGIGLGREFLNLLITRAKESGYKQMYLETVERMERANVLYQKNGFKKLTSNSGNTGHSACDSYYVKEL